MKVLIASDKFKGSLTAREAVEAIAEGWHEAMPDAELDRACLADGGEGTVDVFSNADGAEMRTVEVCDALGRPCRAEFAWIPGERLAVIEMSSASGLAQIPEGERNIRESSTFGTGLLIREALVLDPALVAIGLGGSATNDAGAGLAAALGWQFFDGEGRIVEPAPLHLSKVVRIAPPPDRTFPEILALSDVKNPLIGPRGCSRVYGPQKGASEEDIQLLERNLTHFASTCEAALGVSHRETPGAGAAGGTGFGLLTFCGAGIISGFDWIAERLKLESRVAACDLVLTGEGAIDGQTLEGKGPGALAGMAAKHGKPCIAFGGRVDPAAHGLFSRCISISDPAIGLAENLSRGAELLRVAASKAARTFPS
jgi:glycerate kinase